MSWFPWRLMFHHGIAEIGKPGGRGGFNKKDKKFVLDLVILRCFCFIWGTFVSCQYVEV